MCGIFGVIANKNCKYNSKQLKGFVERLALLSKARGKDSSGFAFKNYTKKTINILKGDVPINELFSEPQYEQLMEDETSSYLNSNIFVVIGHARLVTNGTQLKEYNNQPVTKDGVIGIHNGIIVNDKELWSNNPGMSRNYDIDTEVLLSLVGKYLKEFGDLGQTLNKINSIVEGTVSTALFFNNNDEFALYTNNGSLYYVFGEGFCAFASEKFILKNAIGTGNDIRQLKSFTSLIIRLNKFSREIISCESPGKMENNLTLHDVFDTKNFSVKSGSSTNFVIDPIDFIDRSKESNYLGIIENNVAKISVLKRCKKCILPETFPFIEFDASGECNYCKNHKTKTKIVDFEALRKLVAPYRSLDGSPDCIVPFSGGRDSTYTLHIVKKELGLNPIAFTYDWGMVTDLARRNIARVCGKLGVENIIVSADIKWKRENIRKNIEAWLKYPHLGMIPLFMAGDKYFFYYCNQIKRQTGIKLNIWGINDLENTNFKTGFAGIPPSFNKKRIYSLSLSNQFKLFGFVAQNLIKSPGYFNQSIFDSLGSFAVRYLFPKSDYYHLFDYYNWNEEELEQLILKEYKWEKAIDTESTWRIGDGTASFYNYIYYTVAGFTENDTFRSNQIREGMITREEALNKMSRDNEIRYETLRWYLEIVGIDFIQTIKTINSIPKLYK